MPLPRTEEQVTSHYEANLLSGRTNQIFPALNSRTSNALQYGQRA